MELRASDGLGWRASSVPMSVMLVLFLCAVVVWLLVPGRRTPVAGGDPVEPVDAEALEAAEREVRELGVDQRPDDGFEGDDWGPGAGTQRRGRD